MLTAAEGLGVWLQLSEQVIVQVILVMIVFMSVNLGISIGLLLLYVLSVRRAERSREASAAGTRLNEALESLRSEVAGIKEAVSKVSLEPVLERLTSVESRITALESRTALLERRLARPAEMPALQRPLVRKPPEAAVPSITKLSEISLVFPDVKYAGIITSQGYVVESYGVCSEEPAKLLEIARMYGTSTASIMRGRNRIEIFYLGDVKDLSNYGILEFADGAEISEEVVDAAKKAINKYFMSTIVSRG
jgi:hypothetical protein